MHCTDKYPQTAQSFFSKKKKMASLAKWLSVRLRTKWLCVRILFLSLKQMSHLLSLRFISTKNTSISSGNVKPVNSVFMMQREYIK